MDNPDKPEGCTCKWEQVSGTKMWARAPGSWPDDEPCPIHAEQS